jgi:hypothetical protein
LQEARITDTNKIEIRTRFLIKKSRYK